MDPLAWFETWQPGSSYQPSEEDLKSLKSYLIRSKAMDIYSISARQLIPTAQKVPQIINLVSFTDGNNSWKVLACENFSLWILRTLQVVALDKDISTHLSNLFTPDMADFLFQYILDFWNESGTTLGNILKELFVKIVSFMNKVYLKQNSQVLYKKWLLRILQLSQKMKVVYFMVENLSKEIDDSFFVMKHAPHFSENAISLMWSNALAFPVGKALHIMYRNIFTKEVKDDIEWLGLWKDLVINGLKDSNTRRNVETCLVPHLFKVSSKACRQFITDIGIHNNTSILLGCLRIAQNLAIIEEPFGNGTDTFNGNPVIISLNDLKNLVLQQNVEEYRIDAFALLVSSPKGSLLVQPAVLELIPSFFDLIFIENNIGTRYELFAIFKQFMTRCRDAAYAADRDAKKLRKKDFQKFESEIKEKEQYVLGTQKFFETLLNYSLECLRPGASYQKITSGQNVLISLVKSGLDTRVSSVFYDKHHIDHPYHVPIYENTLTRLLIDNIGNDYEDIRQNSTLILSMAPMSLEEILGGEEDLQILIGRAIEMLNDMKGRKADSGARFFQFIFSSFHKNNEVDKCWDILERLYNKINSATEFAAKDLANAVYQENVQGYYASMKFIFEIIDFKKFDNEKMSQYIAKLILNTSNSWETVKEFLQHHSPEGNLPEELENVYTSELESKYGRGTQILLSYSWRTLKESTHLLSTLLERAPEQYLGDIEKIGQDLLTQLSTVRHRGALSAVYPTFIACCSRCFKSSNEERKILPAKWLNENIEILETRSQKHITRRSAGIPYFITAILTASKGKDNSLMGETITKLLKIAATPVHATASQEDINLPQVNGFNCIKAIFTESSLSDYSIDYVSDALECCLSSFGSPIWAIRNCAVMLFTALQNRLFGNKKTRNNQLPTISSRLFFTRFKKIRNILLNNLTNAVESGLNNNESVQKVFPILTILSRLDDTNLEYRELREFESLIFTCLSSKYWKVREMAARTLPSIISKDSTYKSCEKFLNDVILKTHSQNFNHGNMMAIKELINFNINSFTESEASELFKLVVSKVDYICFSNYKYPYAVILEYFKTISAFNIAGLTPEQASTLGNWFVELDSLVLANPDGSLQLALKELVGILHQYYTKNQEFFTLVEFSELCLTSSNFEVIISAIQFYKISLGKFIFPSIIHTMLIERLWVLCSSDYWSFIKSNALVLLGDLLITSNITYSREELITNIGILNVFLSDSEELSLNSIQLISPFIAKLLLSSDSESSSEPEVFGNWLGKVKKLSKDETPDNLRLSALNSLISFHKIFKGTDKETTIFGAKVISCIFNFLFDDSDELREIASSILCQDMGLSIELLPFETEKLFPQYFVNKFSRDLAVKMVLAADEFGFVSDFQSNFADFESLFIEDSLLFTIEKQNFYINYISRHQNHFIKFLELCAPKSVELGSLKNDTFKKLTKVIQVILKKGQDGFLGWMNEEIYTALYCLLLNCKFLVATLDKDNCQELVGMISELSSVTSMKKMHPLLQSLIGKVLD